MDRTVLSILALDDVVIYASHAFVLRIRGQVDSIERSLTSEDDCADVLMLLANVRGGINSLMAEVLEDHIRLHLLTPERSTANPHELAEDMIELVRAYLK